MNNGIRRHMKTFCFVPLVLMTSFFFDFDPDALPNACEEKRIQITINYKESKPF